MLTWTVFPIDVTLIKTSFDVITEPDRILNCKPLYFCCFAFINVCFRLNYIEFLQTEPTETSLQPETLPHSASSLFFRSFVVVSHRHSDTHVTLKLHETESPQSDLCQRAAANAASLGNVTFSRVFQWKLEESCSPESGFPVWQQTWRRRRSTHTQVGVLDLQRRAHVCETAEAALVQQDVDGNSPLVRRLHEVAHQVHVRELVHHHGDHLHRSRRSHGHRAALPGGTSQSFMVWFSCSGSELNEPIQNRRSHFVLNHD